MLHSGQSIVDIVGEHDARFVHPRQGQAQQMRAERVEVTAKGLRVQRHPVQQGERLPPTLRQRPGRPPEQYEPLPRRARRR
ncbi:hypothetical protein [Dactylosporangium sp. NPDC051484]|uniref:hypothetical protein n=1 Tax=Dactylosporangium sp. NPDC051484 TaxID=3154942 RepID=UPI00344D5216